MLKRGRGHILGQRGLQLLIGLIEFCTQLIGEHVILLLLPGFGPVEYQLYHQLGVGATVNIDEAEIKRFRGIFTQLIRHILIVKSFYEL
jgi:hypothetical protein